MGLFGGFQLVMGDRWMVFVNGKIPSFERGDDWGYKVVPQVVSKLGL